MAVVEQDYSLKYGDRVILRSTQDHKCFYLMARSPSDQQIFVLESSVKQPKDTTCSFSLYNVQQQMVFQLYPKLLYEASKRYLKLPELKLGTTTINEQKETVKNTQDIQKSLLKKRMETEKFSNQNLVRYYRGQAVKYGDQIMLFHPLTQSFIKATNKTLSRSAEFSRQYMFCLSRQLNSNMYFTMNPDPLTLEVKTQNAVRLYDQFLLVTYKMKTMANFSNLLELLRIPHQSKSANLDHNDGFMTLPLVLENHYLYKCYKAYHKITDHDTKEEKSQNALNALVISPEARDSFSLTYGQYVRIKYYKNVTKQKSGQMRRKSVKSEQLVQEDPSLNLQKGYLGSSINALGLHPTVLLHMQGLQREELVEKSCSVFQIVPDNDLLYGKPVMLTVGRQQQTIGHVQLTLRHVLTGKFLRLSNKRNALTLSHEFTDSLHNNQYQQALSPSMVVSKKTIESKSIQMKNQPAMKLYRELQQSQVSQVDEILISSSPEAPPNLLTQPNLSKSTRLNDEYSTTDDKLLFVMKLGSSPTFNKETLNFPINNQFSIASHDARLVIEVEVGEEVSYQEKLTMKFQKYSTQEKDALKKILHEEYHLALPLMETVSKKWKQNVSQQEKEILKFIEEQEQELTEKRHSIGHFKQENYTFMHTFANLNPLKMSYYDVSGSEDFSGSNFWFEAVQDTEIREYNELMSMIAPLMILNRNPILLSLLRYHSNLAPQRNKVDMMIHKSPKKQKTEDLIEEFLEAQRKGITMIQDANQAMQRILMWLSDTDEEYFQQTLSEPLPQRQTLFREIGLIDMVIKLLHELFVYGWLQTPEVRPKEQHVTEGFSKRIEQMAESEELTAKSEIDQLIECISAFLQQVIKNSYENSLYVVQWYFLFKQILLEGRLTDTLRLDLLLMQLFQQTDMNITFQFEIESLVRDARVEKYNKHAYTLLIAFCLHSEYRTRESLEDLITQIFENNKDSIFSMFNYNQDIRTIQMRLMAQDPNDWTDITHPVNDALSPVSAKSGRVPFILNGTEFSTRYDVNEYMISCIRLIAELSKSNPSMVVKHCRSIFPFSTCVQVIQDLRISALTRMQMLEFIKCSYMQHDFKDLRTITFPQYIKFKNKVSENKIMEQFAAMEGSPETGIGQHHYFSQRRIADIYRKMQYKYLKLGGSDSEKDTLDLWGFVRIYMQQLLQGRTIHDIKQAEHQYLQQLFRAFLLVFSKGLFITVFQQDKMSFQNMYKEFVTFLKSSVESATSDELNARQLFKRSNSHMKNREDMVNPDLLHSIVRMTENDGIVLLTQPSRKLRKGPMGAQSRSVRSAVWLDELIEIINLLEKFQQNMIVDDFVQDPKTDRIFDEFSYLEAVKLKNKQKIMNKLKDLKRHSSHVIVRGKSDQSRFGEFPGKEEFASNKELFQFMAGLSKQKKEMILGYSTGIKVSNADLFNHLVELLSFNQTRISAAIVELMWTLFSAKSTFLKTVNHLCVLDGREHDFMLKRDVDDEQQRLLEEKGQESIYTEFTTIFWRIHFALNALRGDSNDVKHYDTINDSLSDILMIFYPDYAAKTDMQNYMELNQVENEERHHCAYEQPLVKSKAKQERLVEMIEQQTGYRHKRKVDDEFDVQNQNIISIERDHSHEFIDDQKIELNLSVEANNNVLRKVSKLQENAFDELESPVQQGPSSLWRVSSSLSVDVMYIYYRQKILRYLGFQELIKGIFEQLILDTNGNIFRERKHTDAKKSKLSEVMNEVLEKSIMFLLYFILKNEDNQELILKTHQKPVAQNSHAAPNQSYLQQLASVENKQLQLLVYKLMAELFRDNYNVLFNLDPYCDENAVIGKLFKKFEYNFSEKNYEGCIYFLQLVPYLVRIKQNEILQNNEIIVQMFKKSKLGIHLKVQALLKKAYECKVESNTRGFDATPHSPARGRTNETLGTIEMPVDICFLTEFLGLVRMIGSRSSPTVDEFTKLLMPITLIQESLTNLDEWYPLKLQVLKYFQFVYLDNAVIAGQEEKNEIEAFVMDTVLKQIDDAILQNHNLIKYRYNRVLMQNSVVFNILQTRTYFSSQDLLYNLDYEFTAYIYVLFGLVEVTGDFMRRVMPDCVHTTNTNATELNVDVFDSQSREDLVFIGQAIFELLNGVRSFIYEHPERSHQPSADKRKPTVLDNGAAAAASAAKSRQRSRMMTKRLLANQNDENFKADHNSLEETPLDEPEDQRQMVTKALMVCRELQGSTMSYQAQRKQQLSNRDKLVFQKWETIIAGSRRTLIDVNHIHDEVNTEMQNLIRMIVSVKINDTVKFQHIISAMISVLSDETVLNETKMKSMTILRKLSNYKKNPEISQSILKDLGDLGFTDFLCDLIRTEENIEQKLEYIKGFVEYLDDSSIEIQTSFLNYLMKDQASRFLRSLQSFVSDTFQDIKMLEKGKSDSINRSQRAKLKSIINKKINSCIYVIEMLRLSCENHFADVQNFFRRGVSEPDQQRHMAVNMIVYVADLFEKYSKIMNEHNAPLGEKMIDFLIETVQGPCTENQKELCQQTRILEVIEEVNLSLRLSQTQSNSFTQRDVLFSTLRYKIFLLQLSMMEGNTDEEIPKKISQFFNPQLLLERLEAVYHKAVKKMSQLRLDISNVKEIIKSKTNNEYGLLATRDTMQTLSSDNGVFDYLEEDIIEEFMQNQSEENLIKESFANVLSKITIEQCEQMVKECFLIYMLLRKLRKYVPQIREFSQQSGIRLSKALNYFKHHTSSIEIINMHGNLEKVYFPIPALMHYLSDETKQNFLEEVSRESINDKINGLLERIQDFYLEITYYQKLHQFGLRYNNTSLTYIRNLCLLIAFLINLLLLVNQNNLTPVIRALGIIEVFLYGFIFCVWVLFRMNLEYKKISSTIEKNVLLLYGKKHGTEPEKLGLRANLVWFMLVVQHMIFNSYTIYWSILVSLSLLGIIYSPMYYGFLLLDIIDHSIVLRNVIKSITVNYKQLLMTAVLGILIFYLYSIVSYQSTEFKQKLEDDNDDKMVVCYNPFQCFLYMMHMGLRAGGGIGDVLVTPNPQIDPQTYGQRVIYDLSFYIIINIIWLNIIFGIIIDTFAELRDQKNLRDYDSQNKCFICNLSRSLFEKEGVSFDNHINKQHHIWSYTAYLVYLKVKTATEHTGIESYVQEKVGKKDISWLPIQKAIKLQQLGVEMKDEE